MNLAEFLALDAAGRAAHIATLTGEQLAELRQALVEHFASLDTDDATAEDVSAMQVVVEATREIDTENSTREEAAAEVAAQRQQLREQMTAPAEPEGGEPEGDQGEPAPEGDATPEGEPAPAEGDAQTPEAIAAAATIPAPARRAALGTMQRRTPATAVPRPAAPTVVPFTIAEGVPSARAGQRLDWNELGRLSVSKLASVEDFNSDGKFPIAHASWLDAYGPDRRLSETDSAEVNSSKVDAFTSLDAMVAAAQAFLATNPSDRDALTAAGGGFCAPFPVDYDVPTVGSTARPVRDALARFGADRGGLQFTTPPVLASSPATDGVSTWDATADAAISLNGATGVYSGTPKPIVEYACLPTTTEQVYAVVMRQAFANFNARFNPEQVGSHQRLGLVNHARLAETLLLTALWNRVSFRVTAATVLGTARDFFAQLDTVLPMARGRERLADNFPMRVIAPSWLADQFRADFVRSMPTADYDTAMALADAVIARWAASRRVNLTFALDDRDASGSYGRTQATLATDGSGTAVLLDHPDVCEWFLFPEGTFQFLDGGTLDLGVVRDSRTNAVNRYETFAETFEGVAKRGNYGYAIRSTFQPTGTASALTAIGSSDL